MPSGKPDYQSPRNAIAVTNVNYGEIADRITGIPRLDGRGNVIFESDFAGGISGWQQTTNSVDETVYGDKVDEYSFNGKGAHAALSAISPNHYPQITRGLWTGESYRYGIECSIYWYPTMGDWLIGLSTYHSGAGLAERVYYNQITGDIRLITPGANYQTIANISIPTGSERWWMSIKLVADWSTHKYIRLLIGEKEYDISAYSLGGSSATRLGYVAFYAQGLYASATNYITRVGNCIITRDEP